MEKPDAATQLEEEFRRTREEQWDKTPDHIKELGAILRRSVDQSIDELAAFLQKHEIHVDSEKLEEFRDVLLVSRVDLKDLEPAARERLRARRLAGDDPKMMTVDYQQAVAGGELPRCRNCRWFVEPPRDDEPGMDKACVAFGTKGADTACFGFTKKITN